MKSFQFFKKYVKNANKNKLSFVRNMSSTNNGYHDIESYLHHHGLIKPQESYGDFLFNNKITTKGETPEAMFHRVAKTLAEAGDRYYDRNQSNDFYSIFYNLISTHQLILSTPFYTNAGRHESKPLSACAIPSINFMHYKKENLQELIGTYHIKGMGTGFNFDNSDNPVEVVKLINDIAVREVQNGLIERPVGNMGILSADHPRALEYASLKLDTKITEWKFNISINLSESFMLALKENKTYKTKYNTIINPESFLQKIAECAQQTGDPGIVFMHRYESANKVPHLGKYKSLSPCGEVALLDGEVCHFGYLNLWCFVQKGYIDYDAMRSVIHHAVVLLDNAIELSLQKMTTKISVDIVSKIRKIGLGVCGYSDLLMMVGVPYDSDEAAKIAEDLISFINYESKVASLELAKIRQPFPAFHHRHTLKTLIIGAYSNHTTDTVTAEQWKKLDKDIHRYGIRNIATVILPPTGRSSLLGGVSASIEPPFKLVCDAKLIKILKRMCEAVNYQGSFIKLCEMIKVTGSVQNTDLPDSIKSVFATCLEISPQAHLRMTAIFQKFTDEAISKTVNLPGKSSASDIVSIYTQAYYSGLKGITIYVNNSRSHQPKSLAIEDVEINQRSFPGHP